MDQLAFRLNPRTDNESIWYLGVAPKDNRMPRLRAREDDT